MEEYLKTSVTGIDKEDVKRRVNDLLVKGYEVVRGGSMAFAEREERGKYIVHLRKRGAA